MFTSKKLLLVGALLLLLVGGWFYQSIQNTSVGTSNTVESSSSSQTSEKNTQLVSVSNISHGHGLAVDIEDPSRIYIATHHGLLVLMNDKDLFKVGPATDDYMGFSPHPTSPKVFFSSGHPSSGGNIGFQKTEDGGISWKKISNGINGPVDFHTMTVSPVNPNLIYGFFAGTLQRSSDEGKSWEIASKPNFPIVNLEADPKNENIVYASSPQGLMISSDKGSTWTKLLAGFASVLVVNPQDSQKLLSYSEQHKLAKSNDGGKTWEKTSADFTGETPLFISFNKQNPEIVYLLTEKNSIYKSSDGGATWIKTR